MNRDNPSASASSAPDANPPAIPAGWEDILDPSEAILWQGRPERHVHFYARDLPEMLMGVFFTGFSIFWMTMAFKAPGNFWMFGLVFFFVGLFTISRRNLLASLRRRFVWYTLTTQRAILTENAPFVGKRLTSYPILAGTKLEFFEGEDLSDIYFAEMTSSFHVNRRHFRTPIGFERIRDGRSVLALMRQVQRNSG